MTPLQKQDPVRAERVLRRAGGDCSDSAVGDGGLAEHSRRASWAEVQFKRVASVYDCLVSIVNMDVERTGQPAELDFAVREIWRRCVAANVALQG